MLATADLARKAHVRACLVLLRKNYRFAASHLPTANFEFKKTLDTSYVLAVSSKRGRGIDMLKCILKVSLLVVSLPLLVSELSCSAGFPEQGGRERIARPGGRLAFTSWNFHSYWIRQRDFLCYIEQISRGDVIGCKDATFRGVPGLAGKGWSFESERFPGHFWRHENSRLKLRKFQDNKLFRADATFYYKRGLADRINGRSFESFNFPRHYIRHRNFELMISPFENSDSFKGDATFMRVVPPDPFH
jgi:Alpha-L-arabinofuranosidase B (ABFB) domain